MITTHDHIPHKLTSFSTLFFFFNETATTEIYTLSLHDALPISAAACSSPARSRAPLRTGPPRRPADRKSTRLNSSHITISYAVFCLKKHTLGGNGWDWGAPRWTKASTARCREK